MPDGSDEPDAHGVAWHEPAVRTAHDAHVTLARQQVVGGLVALAVAAGIWTLVVRQDADSLRNGVETSATVTGGEMGGRRSHDRLFVTYRLDGRSYDGTLMNETTSDHPAGSAIAVVVDPDAPAQFRTRSNPNHDGVLDTVLFIGTLVPLLVVLIGTLHAVAARRWRRWLRTNSTRDVHLVPGTVPRRLGDDGYALRVTSAGPEPLDLVARLTGTRRWLDDWPLLGGPPGDLEGPARVCHGTRRRLVVFDPDVQVPVEVSLPRSTRTARRWMQRFTPDEGG